MTSAADALGFAGLLGLGAVAAWGMYALGAWQDAVRPSRRTLAWALAHGLPADPAELGLPFEDAPAHGPDGPVPCWWIAGRGGAGAPVVVVVHGHGRSRWDSLRRIGPWIDRAALVALPDLRGHGEAAGRSTLGRREPLDLEAVVAEAEARRPGSPAVLVGHSLGAVVAIHAAAARAAAGAPVAEVHAFGAYDRVATPFAARLRARGLPPWPVVRPVLALLRALDGPEVRTQDAAARVGTARIVAWADELDRTSPADDARAIASRAPDASLRLTRGVPHADLGVPAAHEAGAGLTSPRAPSGPAPPTAA
jgi:alpha-beta hydrolase superfamily lysophospholipase